MDVLSVEAGSDQTVDLGDGFTEVAAPPGLELVLSALETGQHATSNRRGAVRRNYRVQARLRLFVDTQGADGRLLFTRNIHARGLGFVSTDRLPLGYGGQIKLRAPDGSLRALHCTLLRCRPTAPGWYEGAVSFNREQPDFCR